jgi:DNA-binding NarL/FixJ family response regulator
LKVVLVDDHPLVWEGLCAVLTPQAGFELAGWASNGDEAEQLFGSLQPDVALVDLRLARECGLDIITRARSLAPACKFIVLTSFVARDDIRRALAVGVDGYILKEALPEEMIAALRLVGRGRPYFDPAVMELVICCQPQQGRDPLADLTEREREILQALALGENNKEIAARLHITEHTVKKHISSILAKLNLKDRTQAALYAVNRGFAGPAVDIK